MWKALERKVLKPVEMNPVIGRMHCCKFISFTQNTTMKKIIFTCTLLLCCSAIRAQFSEDSLAYTVPMERSLLQRYEEALSAKDVSFHTAFRPWTTTELRKAIPFDSLNSFPIKDCP